MQIMHRLVEEERKINKKMSVSQFLFITLLKTGRDASEVNVFTVT